MKTRKALKRLRRVEELLSVVIDEFAGNEPRVREFLDRAKRSVLRAKAGINSLSEPGDAKNSQSKAKQAQRSDLKAQGRGTLPLAGKKRSTVVKSSSERTIGTPVQSAGERHAAKSGIPTPPMTEPAGPPAHEASPELNQGRHTN
jgi:hypothetical protein